MVEHLAGRSFSPPLGSAGYERLLAPNRRPYRTRDGFVAIMPYTTLQWTRFLQCIGRDDLLMQDWIKDPVQRSANVNALYGLIADAALAKTTAEWLVLMDERDIPCGRVNHIDELFAEPHLAAVGLFEDTIHPSEGAMRSIRSPFKVSGVARQPDRPAPPLGDRAQAILEEAGFSPSEREGLFARGVVRRP
jgi:crotonobetainyl-CoA:carnitine CoA-transferase CaiB-like acyl-CoA transferase